MKRPNCYLTFLLDDAWYHSRDIAVRDCVRVYNVARCNFAGLLSLQSTHLRDFRNFRKVMAARMQRLDVDLEKCYENDLDWTLLPQNLRKVSTLLFRNLTLFSQGHQTTVRRRRLKISRWTFHSYAIFEASLINSLWFSAVWFFIFYCTGYTIFLR